jgi:hypothetical protein
LSCNPFLGRIERALCIWLEDLGAELPDLEEADIQVVLDCLAAELPEEDLEQFTVLME